MLQTISKKRKIQSMFFRNLMRICGWGCAAIAFSICAYILVRGVGELSFGFVFSKPSYIKETIGILPDLLNTIYLVGAALALVVPLGVGAAIYLCEYSRNAKMSALIEHAAEILSGIPSIIYGLVGMLFFCQFLGLKTSLAAGVLTMVIMNLPGMIRSAQESLKTVPVSLKEGAYALGAGKWKVIRSIVLPACLPGVCTGMILCCGRMVGESAALLFTAGFAHSINGFVQALQTSGATLSVALYIYAKEQGNFDAAFGIAAILIILVLAINLLSGWIQKRFGTLD